MKNNKLKLILVIFISILFMNNADLKAQLVVNTGLSATDLVDNILGEGVTISSATLVSAAEASGDFADGASTNIGVDRGILLTSGSVFNAPGPNDATGTSLNNNFPGDADLDALVTGSTFDATVLEFDFIPEGTLLSFNYTFASEEYEEYFCTSYNDVFAFLITGPNPSGPDYVNENIALVPGTTDAVSINNVGPSECNGIDNSSEYNNNDNGVTIEYDGFTNVFVVSVDMIPCQSYHIKLAIADRGDRILDSGVFIEAGSFVSSNVQITADIESPICPGGNDGSIDVTVTSGVAPFTFLWENGSTTEDRTDLIAGSYSVEITDALSCSIESFSFDVPDGVDTIAPDLNCFTTTLYYDSNGEAMLEFDDVATATDTCGIDTMWVSPADFSCIIGDYDITVIAIDVNGNMSECNITITVTGDDEDCDGVTDACDVCNGGDDQVDNNGDGMPDCAYPPDFDDIISAWKCGKNNKKVYMCHIPPGNPSNAHTICISPNAIAAHIAHGDYLGPCGNTSCDSAKDEEVEIRNNDLLSMELFPNPATSTINVDVHNLHENANIEIRDHLGRLIESIALKDKHFASIDLTKSSYTSGIYFVSLITKSNLEVRKIVVSK